MKMVSIRGSTVIPTAVVEQLHERIASGELETQWAAAT